MLTAHLEILSVHDGAFSGQKVVTYGVAAVEADAALLTRRITVELNYGDGSAPSIAHSTGGRYDRPVVVAVAASDRYLTITTDLLPYAGSFSLAVLSGETSQISGRASAAEVAAALGRVSTELFEFGRVVSYDDIEGGWRLLMGSSEAAAAVALGDNTLRSAHEFEHVYPVGNFVASLEARNYRSPKADSVATLAELSLSAQSADKAPQVTIYGPILPADVGFPNANQWSFSVAQDLKVLASSVKMILRTQVGERVMLPEYGCDVRRLLFDPNDSSTERDIIDTVRQAITRWEPRVEISDLSVARSNTTAEINLLLVSRLNRERFQLRVSI